LRNANFKLLLDSPTEPVVLRIYEHDASLCRKEADLRRLVAAAVPVPDLLYLEPNGWEDLPPFAILRWIEAITFRDLKRTADRQTIAQASYAAGQTLAALTRFRFPKPGWIGPGPAVTAPLLAGIDPLPRFVDLCLASSTFRQRVPAEIGARVHHLVWSQAPRLAHLDHAPCLVHGDCNKRNLLVRPSAGRWTVAALLDWEFAIAGSPLADLGSFLRYEKPAQPLIEPHFSVGYRDAGGNLPDDWRILARVLDCATICESLASDRLPEAYVPELSGLLEATVAAA
jgi:aminoglycoside phosphotransferase (APT) family kinase protein